MKSLSYDIREQYRIFTRIFSHVKRYRGRLVLGIILSALSGVFAFSPVIMLQKLMDEFIARKDTIPLHYMYIFCGAIVVIYIVKGAITYGQHYLLSYVGQRVIMDLRNTTFEYISGLPLHYFKGKKSGELISRVLSDIGLMELAVSRVAGQLILSIFSFFPPLIAVFYISWRMTIVSLFILPLTFYPILKFAQKLKAVSSTGQVEMANITSIMQEAFYGIHIIKAFNMEPFEFGRFRKSNQAYYNEMMRAARVSALSPSLMELIGALAAAVIFGMGLTQVIQGTLSSGYMFAFLTSLYLMYDPIKKVSRLSYDIHRSIAGAERIFELLDTPSNILEIENPEYLDGVSGSITFDHVDFCYDENQPVLRNIDFVINPGETIAIVGPSGVGKSTLVNLIPRFYDPTGGAILIDGVDIKTCSLKSLRNQIGIVTQETFLFNDSIRTNITFGCNDFQDSEVIAAARSAFAHDFIMQLPNGYETIAGERGVALSGGQRQRLSIARALLKNPPILILDEATSSLDSESEQLIQAALDRLIKDRTTIIIAHRLSTIRKANKIFAMENGEIVEVGTHSELLEKNGAYSRLYRLQFSD